MNHLTTAPVSVGLAPSAQHLQLLSISELDKGWRVQADQINVAVRHVDTVNTATPRSAVVTETIGFSTSPTTCKGHGQQAIAYSSDLGGGPSNHGFALLAHAAAPVMQRHWRTAP